MRLPEGVIPTTRIPQEDIGESLSHYHRIQSQGTRLMVKQEDSEGRWRLVSLLLCTWHHRATLAMLSSPVMLDGFRSSRAKIRSI